MQSPGGKLTVASSALPAGAATDGTDITAPTAMPAGGVGIRGWLSAIWTKLNGTLAVSLATNTPDVTDRSARLLGHVTVDSAPTTAVTAAALPLPAGAAADASLTGGTQRTKITDGTSNASVFARDGATASTDHGVGVVILSTHQPFYQVVTTEITSATATGTKENLTLWHPNTVTKDVFIVEIGVNVRVVQTVGTFAWEMQYISAENGTPAGTTLTAQPLKLSDAASGLVIRQVVTGAPTVTGQMIQRAGFPLPAAGTPFVQPEAFLLFQATDRQGFSDAIVLRNAQAEGLRITQNIIATLTTAPIFTVYVKYVERA